MFSVEINSPYRRNYDLNKKRGKAIYEHLESIMYITEDDVKNESM